MEESTSSTLANEDANLANNESNLANKDSTLANKDLNISANEEANNNSNLSGASSTDPSTNLLVTEPTPSSNLSSECRLDIKISPPDTTTLSNSILSGVKPNLAHKPGVINPMQSDLTLDNLIQKYLGTIFAFRQYSALNLIHKPGFSHLYIFATQCRRS